jgi:predicted pyridoxine 5'-phosphate oxidase superfamily flavin-nucleotide-binding protein
MKSAFHEGELAVQEKAGVSAEVCQLSGMYRPVITPPVQRFLANQRVAALGSVDGDGRVWA